MSVEKQFNVAARRSATHRATTHQVATGQLAAHRALTLVELLVTISIMALVVAISLPMVKPMMESNKTKSGADIVADFLAQARNRAIEEGRPVGVTFERILDYADGNVYPYNGASVLMRQVAEPKPLSGFVKDVRVAVDNTGQITFWTWDNTALQWGINPTELNYWTKLVHPGDQIQFDAKGPKYDLSGPTQIDMGLAAERNLVPPIHFDSLGLPQPALFKVFRKPQQTTVAPTMAPPVAMPEGIVVDLDCSGMGKNPPRDRSKVVTPPELGRAWCDDFSAANQSDRNSVTIMFSPTGEVDKVYYSSMTGSITSDIPTGPVFLNIGIWERAGFWMEDGGHWYISNDYLPDDADLTRNYHDMNNYWVTLFPRTGAVRINRLSDNSSSRLASGAIEDSRKFANSMHGAETR